jgi:hypothetical protein
MLELYHADGVYLIVKTHVEDRALALHHGTVFDNPSFDPTL